MKYIMERTRTGLIIRKNCLANAAIAPVELLEIEIFDLIAAAGIY